jgi:hypothetical protein
VKDFPVVVQDERGLGVAKFGRPAGSAIFNYLEEEGPFGVSHKPTYICQKCFRGKVYNDIFAFSYISLMGK